MKKPLYQHLASLIDQYKRNDTIFAKNPSDENAKHWRDITEDNILYLAKNALPHGSGIDCGTSVAFDASKPDKIVLHTSFHHMDEQGGYSGWTEHKVTVEPSFQGIDITISGRNRNDIKDYLTEVFDGALNEIWVEANHSWYCPAMVEASRQYRFQCVENERKNCTSDMIAEYEAFQKAAKERETLTEQSPVQVSRSLQTSLIQVLTDYVNDIESCLDTDNPDAVDNDRKRQKQIEKLIQELKG